MLHANGLLIFPLLATARHPRASFCVQQKLFAELATFAEPEQRIVHLTDEKSRGDAFEVFLPKPISPHSASTMPKPSGPLTSVPSDVLKSMQLATQDYRIDGVLKTHLGQHSA